MKKILICVDDSVYSLKAANKGILLAKSINAEVSAIHVIEHATIIPEDSDGANEAIEGRRSEAKHLLRKILEMFTCPAITYVEEGRASEKIIETAETLKTDLIVMGTHGKTGLTELLVGGVAEEVLRRSKIPVLIVPFKAIGK